MSEYSIEMVTSSETFRENEQKIREYRKLYAQTSILVNLIVIFVN